MKTLLVIDGHAIIHRAFYALPLLTTKKGVPTNAVYGFFGMLSKIIEQFTPEYVVVCFDTPVRTFRKDLYTEYQSQRPKLTDEFIVQVPIIKELLDAAGIFRTEMPGFEADDVIGTLSKKFATDDTRVVILTGDKDILQLVRDNVFVVTPKVGITTTVFYDRKGVEEKMGLPPEKIPDLKGLMGDPSDNYPGAKGIGPKTAAKLIHEYGSVEHLLESLNSMKEDSTKQKLVEHKEDVAISKTLATIKTDLELNFTIDNTKFTGFNDPMRVKLEEYEMNSLLTRFFNAPIPVKEKKVEKEPEKEPKKTDQIDMF